MAYNKIGYLIRCVESDNRSDLDKYYARDDKSKKMVLTAKTASEAYTFTSEQEATSICNKANKTYWGKKSFVVSVLVDEWALADRNKKIKSVV